MDALLSILPNLSIGVVSIGALVYITLAFIKVLEVRAEKHEKAMQAREDALRQVEKDIRTELIGVLGRSNDTIAQNTKVMERVMNHLDKH